MNLREGIRRLALAVGAIGGCVGLLFGWMFAQETVSKRQRAEAYRKLIGLPVIQDALRGTRTDWFKANSPSARFTIETPSSDIVKQISVERDSGDVTSITLVNGDSLFPVTPPGIDAYWVSILIVVGGFLIPWGTVRALGWVILGFTSPPAKP